MATLCKTFSRAEGALRAAQALRVAGVPGCDIGVLIGDCYGDVRTERTGGELLEVADDAGARRLLMQAHLPDGVARRMVDHLHDGDAVMFVQLDQVDLRTTEALITQTEVAA